MYFGGGYIGLACCPIQLSCLSELNISYVWCFYRTRRSFDIFFILIDDHSRVKLEENGSCDTDYINASYIKVLSSAYFCMFWLLLIYITRETKQKKVSLANIKRWMASTKYNEIKNNESPNCHCF